MRPPKTTGIGTGIGIGTSGSLLRNRSVRTLLSTEAPRSLRVEAFDMKSSAMLDSRSRHSAPNGPAPDVGALG